MATTSPLTPAPVVASTPAPAAPSTPAPAPAPAPAVVAPTPRYAPPASDDYDEGYESTVAE